MLPRIESGMNNARSLIPTAAGNLSLQDGYGLLVVQVAFLPLGTDLNTAVYRVLADDETPYFLKLIRSGVFDGTSVALPKFLGDQGIVQIIAPLATKTGQLWASLDAFKLILHPFVEGHNGFEVDLSDRHWSGWPILAWCGRRIPSSSQSGLPHPLLGVRLNYG